MGKIWHVIEHGPQLRHCPLVYETELGDLEGMYQASHAFRRQAMEGKGFDVNEVAGSFPSHLLIQ